MIGLEKNVSDNFISGKSILPKKAKGRNNEKDLQKL